MSLQAVEKQQHILSKKKELLKVSTLDLIITEVISFCNEYKKTYSTTKHGNMSTLQK